MSRAEKLLSSLERITYEVMRETNRVMAMEKDLYLEDEEYRDEEDDYVAGDYEDEQAGRAKTAYEECQRRAQSNQQSGQQSDTRPGAAVGGDIDPSLFAGCRDKDSLTKRYRSLMKTFHPDNQDGDTEMTIKVQKTYDYMMKQL